MCFLFQVDSFRCPAAWAKMYPTPVWRKRHSLVLAATSGSFGVCYCSGCGCGCCWTKARAESRQWPSVEARTGYYKIKTKNISRPKLPYSQHRIQTFILMPCCLFIIGVFPNCHRTISVWYKEPNSRHFVQGKSRCTSEIKWSHPRLQDSNQLELWNELIELGIVLSWFSSEVNDLRCRMHPVIFMENLSMIQQVWWWSWKKVTENSRRK